MHLVPCRPVALLLALVSFTSLAQELEPTPPPTPAPQPFVPSYQQPGFAYATTPQDAPTEDRGHRVRWGVSAAIGWHLPYHALGVGLEGRVGYQFNSVFSTYVTFGAQLGVGLGIGVTNSSASVSGTFMGHYVMGLIGEAFLGDRFYVGAGPAFGVGTLAVAGINASSAGGVITGVGSYGFKPGFDVRLGFAFGKKNPVTHRRGGFNIGLDALVLYHPGAVFTRVEANDMGANVEVMFQDKMWTVTPMLTLGYDAR